MLQLWNRHLPGEECCWRCLHWVLLSVALWWPSPQFDKPQGKPLKSPFRCSLVFVLLIAWGHRCYIACRWRILWWGRCKVKNKEECGSFSAMWYWSNAHACGAQMTENNGAVISRYGKKRGLYCRALSSCCLFKHSHTVLTVANFNQTHAWVNISNICGIIGDTEMVRGLGN